MDIWNFVDNPPAELGFVDGFTEFSSGGTAMLRLMGWALDPTSPQPRPGHSVVVVDEKRNVLGETRVLDCRSDVAVYHHQPDLSRCGWKLFLSSAALGEGSHVLSAYTVDPERRVAYRLNGNVPFAVSSSGAIRGSGDRGPRGERPRTRSANRQLNLEEQIAGRTTLASTPTLVLLDLTQKCNLNCVMCYRYNTDLDGHISDELYERVRTELFPGVEGVVLCCKAGEPTLYPRFDQVVKDIVDNGAKGTLITNATVLRTELIRQLVDADFEVHFSVDGATARTYEFIRGYKLSRIADRIREYVAYKRSSNGSGETRLSSRWPKTIVNFTPMMVNVREVPDMVDLVADWGVEGLFVQRFSPNNAYTGANWSPESDPALMERLYDQATQRAEKRRVTLVIDDMLRYQPPADPAPVASDAAGISSETAEAFSDRPPDMMHLGCTRPFTDAIIGVDGGVTPCCLGAPTMGYLQYQSLDEIWNGPAWRELRRGLVEGEPPEYCRKCRVLRKSHLHKISPSSQNAAQSLWKQVNTFWHNPGGSLRGLVTRIKGAGE